MKIDITSEIRFQTARSGGKGGQNVNKVETMVEGRWDLGASSFFNEDQKSLLREKLSNRMSADGNLLVKSQVSRSQLGNKQIVIEKINELVEKALIRKKARLASRPTKASIEKE